MKKALAPICLFTYNRLDETQKTVNALKNNFLAGQSDLIVFSDGVKDKQSESKIIELRKYIKTINGFGNIVIKESAINKGLANSIIDGVTEVINEYGKVIVIEDDLVSTPNFLDFMNQALNFYENSNKIQSINGYSLKVKNDQDMYFHRRTFPWGWATWKDRWDKQLFDKSMIQQKILSNKRLLINFNKLCGNDMAIMLQNCISGAIDSWYVRWAFDHFLNSTYAVYPDTSKIINIGFGDEATHCLGVNTYVSQIDNTYKQNFSLKDFKKIDESINNQFLNFFTKKYKLIFRLKMLKNSNGRHRLFEEIKMRFLKSKTNIKD